MLEGGRAIGLVAQGWRRVMTFRYYDISKKQPAVEDKKSLDLTGATRWLTGQERRIAELSGQAKAASGRSYISPETAARLTENYLGQVGVLAREFFDNGMPPSYALPSVEIKTALVEKLPHLGYCSFAAVKMFKNDGSPYIVRFHFANFRAQIDTTPGSDFFKLKSADRSEMYFGIAYCLDGRGPRTVSIDRSVHHSGVSFITNDPRKALDNAILMRTGVSIEEWRKLAAQRAAENKKVAA